MVRIIRGVVCLGIAVVYAGCLAESEFEPVPEEAAGGSDSVGAPRGGHAGSGGRRSPPRRPSDAGSGGREPSSVPETPVGSAGEPGEAPSGGGGAPTDLGEGGAGGFEPGSESGGAPAVGGAGGDDEPTAAELGLEMRARWNPIAASRPPNAYEFGWTDFFPHPTFKMGTPEGYHEFAFVLVGFFEAGDNFDFLVTHELTRTPLDCGIGMFVTFDELAEDFSTMTYGDIPADVQSRLKSFSARMP